MSNRSRYKLKTQFVNKQAFFAALPIIEQEYALQGLKLVHNEKAKTILVDFAPIQTFRRENLVFQEQKNEIVCVADPYMCEKALNDLVGAVERVYKAQLLQEYYAYEGYAVQTEELMQEKATRISVMAY
jgi:hypothetical protein